jgi:hypothetical protein
MQRKYGSICYDTGVGYMGSRNRINRSPQQLRSTSSDPQGTPQRNPLTLSRSSSGRKPGVANIQQSNGSPSPKLILTVLSVTFWRRTPIVSVSIGCSSNSDKSSTAFSRSLVRESFSSFFGKRAGFQTFDCPQISPSGFPSASNTP